MNNLEFNKGSFRVLSVKEAQTINGGYSIVLPQAALVITELVKHKNICDLLLR